MKSLSELVENPGALYDVVVDNLEDYAVFVLDPNGHIATWNQGAQRLIGYTEKQIIGQPASIIFTEEDVANGVPRKEMDAALTSGTALDERWHVKQDGSRFWASGHLTDIRSDNGELIGFVKIVRDLTEQHQQEQVRKCQLREVATRLTRVEQRERQRLATDLHSTLAQELLSCRLKLATVETADERSQQRCNEVFDLLDRSMHYVRNLIAMLSPVMLQTMTLGEALHSLADRMERDRELKVHLDVDQRGIPLEQEMRVLLFQSAYELLLNVSKHADVNEAKLALWKEEHQAYLRVSDSGSGMSTKDLPTETNDTGGFGLLDVRDRVQMLGGEVKIHSSPEEGTTVTVSVPLMEEAPSNPPEV